jgi:hypothetical protein
MPQLPPEAGGWSRTERALAYAVLDGRTVVVNVRKSGPHKHLVPWLDEVGLLTYVGHAGPRHSWPESDFANPYLNLRDVSRTEMVRHYRKWLAAQPDLVRRIHDGELTGRAVGCWCAPEKCHADVLAEEANRVQRRPE